jgi:hypothetical protein
MYKFLFPFLLSVSIAMAMISSDESEKALLNGTFVESFRQTIYRFLYNKNKVIIDHDTKELVKRECQWLDSDPESLKQLLSSVDEVTLNKIEREIKYNNRRFSRCLKNNFLMEHQAKSNPMPKPKAELIEIDVQKYVLNFCGMVIDDYKSISNPE